MTESTDKDENRLVGERRAKLDRLREEGYAFPNDFRRDSVADELLAAHGARDAEALEREAIGVKVAGRMMNRRVMGKNSFVKLQDHSGQIQLFIERDRISAEHYNEFKKWDLGDILGAEGSLFKTRTGELSVKVERLVLLVKSLRPLPEKWHGIADQELKFRQRYLDLIVNAESREVFRARTQIVKFMRGYLDTLGFFEAETPMMHPIPGGAAARPFETYHHALDKTVYLRVAPELYLKRLMIGGFERVYELNRVFRNEGLSTRHNPEFTILELYQAYATFDDVMALTEQMLRECARALLGTTRIEYQGDAFDLGRAFPRVRLEQSLIDRVAELNDENCRDEQLLRGLCAQHGIELHSGFGAGKLQLELFEKLVEDDLAGPIFVTHFPAEVSPLARRNDADPFLTDRFELFIGGREMANGFSELNDPEDQADRFHAQLEAMEYGDDEAMHFDHDYVKALEYGMPPAAGLGIGVDRLVMLLTDSASIRDVLLFPQLR